MIILRGNSATGKSSVARVLRERYGRGLAWVSQDLLRRTVLGERDTPDGHNIGLIDQTARYALDHGFHVVLDGILHPPHYAPMIHALVRDHRGVTAAYYLDADFAETVRRHATKPERDAYGPERLRSWFVERSLVDGLAERVIGAESTLTQTVDRVLGETGLVAAPRPMGPGCRADAGG